MCAEATRSLSNISKYTLHPSRRILIFANLIVRRAYLPTNYERTMKAGNLLLLSCNNGIDESVLWIPAQCSCWNNEMRSVMSLGVF